MVAPIVSTKHYVQLENSILTTGTRRSAALVEGVAVQSVAASDNVIEGSMVKAVFIEIWVKSNASATEDTKFQLLLEKVPAGQTAVTFTQMNNLMTYSNKKNILYFSQGVIGDGTTQGIPVVRNWFKIPRGKQRFGLGDTLALAISTTAASMQNCGFATFKEYK